MIIIQAVIAIVSILFIPGFFLSLVFFRLDQIDWLERISLSFALSITTIPLIVFYVNLLGFKTTSLTIIIEILAVIFFSGMILSIRYVLFKKNPAKITYIKFSPKINIPKTTENKIILVLHTIMREFFQISLITYLILLLAEKFQTGFVSNYFNLSILLVAMLISGMGMVATSYDKKETGKFDLNWKNVLHFAKNGGKKYNTKLEKWHKYYILLASVGGGILVYYKTIDMGGVSIIFSLTTMVIISLLSYLILSEE